jgi:hypothetical protein
MWAGLDAFCAAGECYTLTCLTRLCRILDKKRKAGYNRRAN